MKEEEIKNLMKEGRDIDPNEYAYNNTKKMQKTFYFLCYMLAFGEYDIVSGSQLRTFLQKYAKKYSNRHISSGWNPEGWFSKGWTDYCDGKSTNASKYFKKEFKILLSREDYIIKKNSYKFSLDYLYKDTIKKIIEELEPSKKYNEFF